MEKDTQIYTSSVFLMGLGECGGNLVGEYINKEKEGGGLERVTGYLILNTNRYDLVKVREKYKVPPENILMFGDTPMGVGGRFMEAYNLVEVWWDAIAEQIRNLGGDAASTFIILTSTGGGTGCGATPALIRKIRETFGSSGRVYVYVLGVLPFEDQTSEALNTIWLLHRLLQEPEKGESADLAILLSNRTMLRRRLQYERTMVMDILSSRLGIDIADVNQLSTLVTASELPFSSKILEQTFVDIVNPLIVQTLIKLLQLSTFTPGKNIFPVTDMADIANKLDTISIPAIFTEIPYQAVVDEQGKIDMDGLAMFLQEVVNVAIKYYSLVDIQEDPKASSVLYLLSGPKGIVDVHLDRPIKEALNNYIAEGAAVTPTFIQYDSWEVPMDLLILLGLPKLQEIRDIVDEAEKLIKLHSGSKIKERWFLKSKGVSKEVLVEALNEIKDLFDIGGNSSE
ncbi:MAG: hypothetical protein Q6368_009520 [Candidatus Baldrarchaeota archaeon]